VDADAVLRRRQVEAAGRRCDANAELDIADRIVAPYRRAMASSGASTSSQQHAAFASYASIENSRAEEWNTRSGGGGGKKSNKKNLFGHVLLARPLSPNALACSLSHTDSIQSDHSLQTLVLISTPFLLSNL
jgi:hypothetical protein